jgi:hypothetical protein
MRLDTPFEPHSHPHGLHGGAQHGSVNLFMRRPARNLVWVIVVSRGISTAG